jgi:hypothetical protein
MVSIYRQGYPRIPQDSCVSENSYYDACDRQHYCGFERNEGDQRDCCQLSLRSKYCTAPRASTFGILV